MLLPVFTLKMYTVVKEVLFLSSYFENDVMLYPGGDFHKKS